jgi:hypothetical protein
MKIGLLALEMPSRIGVAHPGMSVDLGHERGDEMRDRNISGKWKEISEWRENGYGGSGRG